MSAATDTDTQWQPVCPLTTIVTGTGVCALHDGHQVAVLRLGDEVFAIDNRDPFSGAPVLSRGLIGDVDGAMYVASPLYKQRFDLATGACLDDEAVRLSTWAVRVNAGMVELGERSDG